MTSEIAIMNKSAVALAADSAVTAEIDANTNHYKVFNTANKLFTLSKYHPVGVMVYNTMELCAIPWETIIKLYRKNLEDEEFKDIDGYFDDFCSYLNNNVVLFQENRQRTIIFVLLARYFSSIKGDISTRGMAKKAFEEQVKSWDEEKFSVEFSEKDISLFEKKYKAEIESAAKLSFSSSHLRGLKRVIRRLGALVLCKARNLSGYTGIVIAGFGGDEVFPFLKCASIDAVVDGRLRMGRVKDHCITEVNNSDVVPFAQEDMVRAILDGVHPRHGRMFIRETLRLGTMVLENVTNKIPRITEKEKEILAKEASREFIDSFTNFVKKMDEIRNTNYTKPIKDSIALMPISELGHLAEMFVNLTQIRQRMSLDIETVGGPIDVAVISKGDGFVWLKRKHYFDKNINQTFVERYFR